MIDRFDERVLDLQVNELLFVAIARSDGHFTALGVGFEQVLDQVYKNLLEPDLVTVYSLR